MTGTPSIFLIPGGDRRAAYGHPWVYSNEIRMDAAAKALPPGTVVVARRADGKALGQGTFNPHSLIALRFLTRDAERPIDQAFLAERLRRALALRQRLFAEPHYRLIHAEADGLPGLVVDRFGDVVSVQANTAGMDALLEPLLAAIDEVIAPRAVVLRNDTPARQTEGLDSSTRLVRGDITGPVEVIEHGVRFLADPLAGQKTGLNRFSTLAGTNQTAGFSYSSSHWIRSLTIHAISGKRNQSNTFF